MIDDHRPGRRVPLRPLAAAAALAAVVGCAAWLWSRGRPERSLAEAARLLRDGQPLLALERLEAATTTPRTADRARLLQARIAIERGRPERAVEPLERIPPDSPAAAEAAYWKGRALLAVGNLPYALLWFREALARRPEDPETVRWAVVAAYDLGDLRTVLKLLEVLTRTAPDDPRAWRTLGLVTLEQPESGEPELAAAADAYRTSLRLDPNQPKVRRELAEVLIRWGRLDEAYAQLEACRGTVPEADRATLLGQVHWARGDHDAARAVVAAALAAAPDHPGLLTQRGQQAQAEGRLEEAVAWYTRAAVASPYDSQIYYRRSLVHRALGHTEAADEDQHRAAELKQAFLDLSALNAEASARPTDPDVRYRLGRLCERLGKRELAASWYRAALACDPHHEEARLALLTLHPAH